MSFSARILAALDSDGSENPLAMDLCASRVTASGKLTSPSRAHAGSHGTGLHRQCGCRGGRTPLPPLVGWGSRCLGSKLSPSCQFPPAGTILPAYARQLTQASRSDTHTSYLALLAVEVACIVLVTCWLTVVVIVLCARATALRARRSPLSRPRSPRRSTRGFLSRALDSLRPSSTAALTAARASFRSTGGAATLVAAALPLAPSTNAAPCSVAVVTASPTASERAEMVDASRPDSALLLAPSAY